MESGGCLTNILQALQNNGIKIYNARNHIFSENFELRFLKYKNFERIYWRACEALVQHTPGYIPATQFRHGIN